MRIVAICGSPRGKKSQTKILAEKVLDAAKAKGADVEMVDLSKARIKFCRACEVCHRRPDCVLNDDVKGILAKALAADGLLLASPVCLNQVTAQLKAVLDRSSHLVHCLLLMGKYVAAVTTCGGGGGSEVIGYLKEYAFTVGAQFVGGVDAKVPLKDSDFVGAVALGKTLVAAIQKGKSYPDQLQSIEERKKYFGKLIARRKNDWPYEYKYWSGRGWL
jgi:multimeric flavodoxin WrbA